MLISGSQAVQMKTNTQKTKEKSVKQVNYFLTGMIGMFLFLAAGLSAAQEDQAKSLHRAVIRIDTLSCSGCFSTINAGLASLDGYSGMGANLFRKLIAVDFTAPLTKEDISRKLAEVGYPGQVKAVNSITEKESFAYIESKRAGFRSNGGGCCSGGGYPGSAANQGGAGQTLPSGGSCCTLPAGPGQGKSL